MTPFELGIVLLSALLHAAWSVSIKGSRDPLAFNVLQILPQAVLALGLCFAIDLSSIPTPVWTALAGTAVAHSLYLYWMCRAYSLADLTLVYPIARSTPAFLPLVAIPLLGETLTPLGGLGIATVVGGIWLVHSGGGLRWRSLFQRGIVYAYLTLATTVAYGILDKQAMAALDAAAWTGIVPRAVAFYFLLTLGTTLLFVPLAVRRSGGRVVLEVMRKDQMSVFLSMALTIASYGLILEALRTAPASYVVAVRQSSVLFTVAMSVFWLGERPGPRQLAGATATVAGVALVAWAG